MDSANCMLGLEQEFFLVDGQGNPSNKADAFLEACWESARYQRRSPECFKPEFVKNIIELNTVPCRGLSALTRDYIEVLELALDVAQELDLKLYPLSTYPLHIRPVMRDKLNYHVQLRTIGLERFDNAAKCTGTHLHIGMPPGTIDPHIGVAYAATGEAKNALLNIYNLATALDAALITLSRACPFYEGRETGMAMRTVHYRGSEYFGWEGVYTHLQSVGGLLPYVESIEKLVEQQFYRYYSWLEAMDRAGVERRLFLESGGELLKVGWNPVRVNKLGTVELRSMDSNYPEVVLALITLVVSATERVLRERLTVKPEAGLKNFVVRGRELLVPEFDYLNGTLLYGAVTEGIANNEVMVYLDSVLNFAIDAHDKAELLAQFKTAAGEYRTTETEILQQFSPTTEQLSREEGLHLVRHGCDKLEHQVRWQAQRIHNKLPPKVVNFA